MTATASAAKPVSAIERLRSLPPLFRGADLTIRFQWTSKTASHYLWMWKKRGLVVPLGGHSDVFANTLKQPQPNWEAALLMALPTAVLIGIDCLRREGWATQIPARPDVAVDQALPVYQVERFNIQPRDRGWFDRLRPTAFVRAATATLVADRPLPVLRPAWALADMLATEGWGACALQPDDLDETLATAGDRRDWLAACKAFGVSTQASFLGA